MPLNPFENNIHFPRNVQKAENYRHYFRHPQGSVRTWGFSEYSFGAPGLAHTWADFGKDVFIFGSGLRWPGQHRFLYHMNPKVPQIEDDHWAHGIRNLGMYVPKMDSSLCGLDRRTFLQLRGLRKVFLVIETDVLSRADHFLMFLKSDPRFGFVPLDEAIERIQQQGHKFAWTLPYLQKQRTQAGMIRTQLLQLFKEGNRDYIGVDLVIDTSTKCFYGISDRLNMTGSSLR
ncbi:hypothetical protein GGR58DRAFT_468628 [Xylaria digitata]|nr:hypothetical protein GGR58DRAFT_468628 [Xylaria digitata]